MLNYIDLVKYLVLVKTRQFYRIKQNQALVIVIPDNDNKEYNYDAINGLLNGCQFNCMKLQFYDNNLMAYNNFLKIIIMLLMF